MSANLVVQLRRAPTAKRTQMETMILDAGTLESWKTPPFQRPLHVNDKVRKICEDIKADGGVIPGVITLGVLERGNQAAGTYLVDGQHRIEAFRMSGLSEGLADVRVVVCETMGQMGGEWVSLNSQIVRMRPDDVLRGLEGSIDALRMIRRECPFVGYDQLRRNDKSPVLSMSSALRSWAGSSTDTPSTPSVAATRLAEDMTADSAERITTFLKVAHAAWGRGADVSRLWLSLNITVTMWLWRQIVLDTDRGLKRSVVLKPDQFRKCLMSVAAARDYSDWLLGRMMNERDRSPCYERLKTIFARRLADDGFVKPLMPGPAWAHRRGS